MSDIIYSVVIRSFNEQKHIARLIDGLQQQSVAGNMEIILVDSGSTDETVKIATQKGAKIVTLTPIEFSFGRALNLGCAVAKGKFLLFASAHVYPLYTDWVELMAQPFANSKIALVYGKQVGNNQTKYSEHQIFAKWFPRTSNYQQQTPFCNNANAMISKELWEKNKYDEQLTGLEDLDWAVRLMEQGFEIAYEANAPIVHVHEETMEKIKNRYRREAIALKKIFPREKFSLLDFAKLLSSNIATDCIHALRDKVFLRELLSIAKFRTMQFTGTYLGFHQRNGLTESLKRRLYYPPELTKNPDPDSIFKQNLTRREASAKAISY